MDLYDAISGFEGSSPCLPARAFPAAHRCCSDLSNHESTGHQALQQMEQPLATGKKNDLFRLLTL